jgi:hypothetical protein
MSWRKHVVVTEYTVICPEVLMVVLPFSTLELAQRCNRMKYSLPSMLLAAKSRWSVSYRKHFLISQAVAKSMRSHWNFNLHRRCSNFYTICCWRSSLRPLNWFNCPMEHHLANQVFAFMRGISRSRQNATELKMHTVFVILVLFSSKGGYKENTHLV